MAFVLSFRGERTAERLKLCDENDQATKVVSCNCKNLSCVSGYCLKTAMMLEIKKDGGHRSDKQLGEKFKEMMEMLRRYLTHAYLPSLHSHSVDLLNYIKSIVTNKASGRMIELIGANESVKILDKLVYI